MYIEFYFIVGLHNLKKIRFLNMAGKMYIPTHRTSSELSDREKDILRTIIHLYILQGAPVGSRNLAKYLELELKLSPATIRNVMSDLEDMDYISHPHTSAGRIPTDKGYRYYVDTLMNIEHLNPLEKKSVKDNLSAIEPDNIFREASKVLGLMSRCLSIVEIPHLASLKIEKLEIVQLSSSRLLIILALDSNIVRTVTLEAEFEIKLKEIERIATFINEKISGKTLKEINENFVGIMQGSEHDKTPLIRLFVNSIDKLFENQSASDRLHITGTQNLLSLPEFDDINRVKSVIELVENEDVIIHILDKYESEYQDMKVLIGSEMNNKLLDDYSLIVTSYKIGSAVGSIGIIGPKRMNYPKLTSLVHYVGEMITRRER